MLKILLFCILIIGVIFVSVEITKTSFICPKEKVVYKYLPKTLEEAEKEPDYVTDIFRSMFLEPSPWVVSLSDINKRKQEAINRYFVSQI